jgi:hypothetical protein
MIGKTGCLAILPKRTMPGLEFPATPHGNNSSPNWVSLKSENTCMAWRGTHCNGEKQVLRKILSQFNKNNLIFIYYKQRQKLMDGVLLNVYRRTHSNTVYLLVVVLCIMTVYPGLFFWRNAPERRSGTFLRNLKNCTHTKMFMFQEFSSLSHDYYFY